MRRRSPSTTLPTARCGGCSARWTRTASSWTPMISRGCRTTPRASSAGSASSSPRRMAISSSSPRWRIRPASRRDCCPGDQILKINGSLAEKMDLSEAIAKLRGDPGEKVTLTDPPARDQGDQGFHHGARDHQGAEREGGAHSRAGDRRGLQARLRPDHAIQRADRRGLGQAAGRARGAGDAGPHHRPAL